MLKIYNAGAKCYQQQKAFNDCFVTEGQKVVAVLPGPRIKNKEKHWENIVVLIKVTIFNFNMQKL